MNSTKCKTIYMICVEPKMQNLWKNSFRRNLLKRLEDVHYKGTFSTYNVQPLAYWLHMFQNLTCHEPKINNTTIFVRMELYHLFRDRDWKPEIGRLICVKTNKKIVSRNKVHTEYTDTKYSVDILLYTL